MKRSFQLAVMLSASAVVHAVVATLAVSLAARSPQPAPVTAGEAMAISLLAWEVRPTDADFVAPAEPAPLAPPEPVHVGEPEPEREVSPATERADAWEAAALPPAVLERVADVVASGDEEEDVGATYWEGVRRKIAGELRYGPGGVGLHSSETRIHLHLVLDGTGGLVDVRARPPYGRRLLTAAAIEAVRRAAPFGPPPGLERADERVDAELPVRFVPADGLRAW